jgi:hypothetical protein
MKLNKGLTLVLCLLVATIFVATTFAQETTGGMQGTIRDPQGAVVSRATVEVASPALIGTKKVETDAGGYYRFANLPPGPYTLSISAKGFKSIKQTGLVLEVGKLPTIDITLEVGAIEQTVEVSSAAPIVDVAQSKVQTNVTEEVMNAVPKGRSFQSVIQFAPGARNEPLQSGYQIDGATSSENSYLVEGQETAAIQTGASDTNVPTEFIQEVQIKTSGFEAEYGGALGGVVNVIQKRGSNAWHGSVFTYYQGDTFDAAPSRYLRKDPVASPNGGHSTSHFLADGITVNPNWCGNFNTCRLDVAAQSYQPKKDHYRIPEPGFELGGYIVKDKLWIFASAVPRYYNRTRTVKFDDPAVGTRAVDYNSNTYNAMSRVDYLVSSKIRVYGSWQTQYRRTAGTTQPNADDVFGLVNTSAGNPVDNYNHGIGTVEPNMLLGAGADITITPNLVATSRLGRFYSDYQDRGLPVGVYTQYRDSNYNYPGVSAPGTLTALDGTPLSSVPNASTFIQTAGYTNIGDTYTTQYDKYSRLSYSQDAAYFKKAFGTHNFKFGYALNRLSNNVSTGYNTAEAFVAYGTPYVPLDQNASVCAAISAQNITLYGNSGVSASDTTSGASCTGLWGTINFQDYGTLGKVSSLNHSLYLQDAWTVGPRVTLNVGLRADKESLPPYETSNGFKGINFGFGDKLAPRLGGSWDVLGNGKMKVYGSFGYFYDIMKFELPRGSFGGDWWHDCVYALDTPDWTSLVPTRPNGNGHFCPGSGPANGNLTGVRFIENQDYRAPSNDPNNYLIDPNLKPMKQHEMVMGADYAFSPAWAFESRYSRKRLDRTIEDAGILTPAGEQFYIINPGMGIHHQPVADCPDCPVQPKANRRYDGVEFRLVKRPGAGSWFATVSYTYSRLYGNYSGLTATDVSDSGYVNLGRQSPNVDRAFDEPFMQFDSHGKLIDGPLATDRPNTFKAYGYYRLKWFRHETMLGAYQQWYSGTPLSSYISVWGAPVFVEGRGKWVDLTRGTDGNWSSGKIFDRRGNQFSQTDFSLVQEFHVSKSNEKLVAGFEANVTNVFNQHAATVYNQNMVRSSYLKPGGGLDYQLLMTGYDYISAANTRGVTLNSEYGLPMNYQDGRSLRFKFKFAF